jgi:hypothetical protein
MLILPNSCTQLCASYSLPLSHKGTAIDRFEAVQFARYYYHISCMMCHSKNTDEYTNSANQDKAGPPLGVHGALR